MSAKQLTLVCLIAPGWLMEPKDNCTTPHYFFIFLFLTIVLGWIVCQLSCYETCTPRSTDWARLLEQSKGISTAVETTVTNTSRCASCCFSAYTDACGKCVSWQSSRLLLLQGRVKNPDLVTHTEMLSPQERNMLLFL